jgi:hypothetical protein
VCCAWGEAGHTKVKVGAEWCTVDIAVDRAAARIEDVIAMVTGGCSIAGVEGAAETGAARVMHKPTVIAVVTRAATIVCEGVAAEAAGVHAADGVVLRTDAVIAELAASGVKSKVAIDAVKAISCTCRGRTAVASAAAAGIVIAIPY